MRIIVCGGGQVGRNIAQQLANEENDITIIDMSHEITAELSQTMDVKTITGFASYPSVLEQAGAESADAIIAVTHSDEVNMLACQVAHSIFKIPFKVARIRNQDYLNESWVELFQHDHLPIDLVISPEIAVASSIKDRLQIYGTSDMISLAGGEVKIISITSSYESVICNITIGKIKDYITEIDAKILGISRNDEFIIPDNDEECMLNDEIYILVKSDSLSELMDTIGYNSKKTNDFVIIGGGNIGFSVASYLEEEPLNYNVKIIELDLKRAEKIAEELKETTVLHGNALDHKLLNEVNIKDVSAVICVTNDDKVNIIASLIAKKLGCPRAMTLINNKNAYLSLITSLGIDTIINPKDITASIILSMMKGGQIKLVHPICDGLIEILEICVANTSPIIGKTISDLDLYDVVFGAILRDGELILNEGEIEIRENDTIIVLSTVEASKKVQKILSVKFEYF